MIFKETTQLSRLGDFLSNINFFLVLTPQLSGLLIDL